MSSQGFPHAAPATDIARYQQLSQGLHDLHGLTARFYDLWAFRWLLFVRNSPAGTGCTFAQAARRKSLTERQALKELLKEIQTQALALEAQLDQVLDVVQEEADAGF